MRTVVAIALASLLVLLVAGPTVGRAARPMTGRFTASVAPVVQRCGPEALTLGFDITGVASHLGKLTGSGSNCTEPDLGTSAVAVWDGEATFTAADGSTLTTTSAGMQDAPEAGMAAFEITHTITGGSGRLADASGVWIVAGTINFVTGQISGTVVGWMSY